jgi:dTDP-4-amino-4,6-dideoxygalactose transaminase
MSSPTTARMTPKTAARAIPFFDYPRVFTSEEEDLVAIFRDAGRRGAFVLQSDLVRFEANLAAFLGAKYALGVGNATDGLLIALRAAGIDSGEVIFPSHTMVATAAAIHFAGATPVPVDCGADHLLDPAAVEAAITPHTRALVPVHLNGRTCDMDALGAIAARHHLHIIEDAAQALGSRFKDRAAGTFGAGAAISFFPAKTLGCLGDGGAVIANDGDIFDGMCQLRDHGRRADGEIVSWGLNSRLDNLQAAILDHRLESYDHAVERRRAIARLYRDGLATLAELVLPPGPDGDADHFDVFQNYEVEVQDREVLRAYLQSRGISTILPWGGKAVHQWPRLELNADLPRTERLFERVLLLPMHPYLADSDVQYICETIAGFYRA